jgi:hypothetical protein
MAVCVAIGATACDPHVYLGRFGDDGGLGGSAGGGGAGGGGILWQATFEPGDLSEWLGDGNGGIYMDGRSAAPTVSQDVAHRGRYSGVATFAPTSMTNWAYLYRNQPSPPEAYYGAWFFIPAAVQVGSWLSLHHFGYHQSPGSPDTSSPVWDFNVHPAADGTLIARLYEASIAVNTEQASPIPVPLATWVHFEIFFKKAADAAGHITVWQDGVQILDVANAITAPTDAIQWDVGGGSSDISPSPVSIYFDDATISTTRVGPGT